MYLVAILPYNGRGIEKKTSESGICQRCLHGPRLPARAGPRCRTKHRRLSAVPRKTGTGPGECWAGLQQATAPLKQRPQSSSIRHRGTNMHPLSSYRPSRRYSWSCLPRHPPLRNMSSYCRLLQSGRPAPLPRPAAAPLLNIACIL